MKYPVLSVDAEYGESMDGMQERDRFAVAGAWVGGDRSPWELAQDPAERKRSF